MSGKYQIRCLMEENEEKDKEIERLRDLVEVTDNCLIEVRKERNVEARKNRRLQSVKMLYKHALDSLNFLREFSECDKARELAQLEVDRFNSSELKEK